MRNVDKYQTQNINLSAAILAKGIQLVDYYANPAGQFSFVFDDANSCREIERQWLTNQLDVKAYEYSQAMRQLKSVIHERSVINVT